MADTETDATGPTISFVLATYERPDDVAEAVASILDQNYRPIEIHVLSHSAGETAELFTDGGKFDMDCVRYYQLDEHMGGPRTRNRGYEHAEGDILVTIDDDAVLHNDDAAHEIVRLFDEHDDVGILSFQCRDYDTGTVNHDETPDPPELSMSPRQTYRATNFTGGGNAIRRTVIDDVGAFPERFEYGFEEMDLSLRAHEQGYDVLYTPNVVVRHKKSPEGRKTPTSVLEHLVENRIRLTIRNLPVRYVVCSTILWAVYGLLTMRSFDSFRTILGRLYRDRSELRASRTVVSQRTIDRIKSRKTMLYWWWYGPNPKRIFGPNGDLRRLFWEL